MFAFLLITMLTITHYTFAQPITQKLDQRMIATNSLVCVGLDPDITKMPLSILETDQTDEEKVYSFLTTIIDITAPHACSYKLQKAFYDLFDEGHELLRKTVAYIHDNYSDIPVFVDCKIGDTDNTMIAYMHLLFKDIKADGVVINPYMGDDVLEPFMNDAHKCAIVLLQTSNPRGKIVQEIITEQGIPLWEEMLHLTINRWNTNKNLIAVLSSNTDVSSYVSIRNKIPQDMPILLAGIGLQGGNPEVLKQLLDNNNRGVFVNSSRGIIYPYLQNDENWQTAVVNAAIELKEMLNAIRNS
jgi:orotidine-5'-phosphate decarboxylase